MNSDENVFKPLPEYTAREMEVFIADLKDPTVPESYERAWCRLWTQIKKWAQYIVAKTLYGAVAEEKACDLSDVVMESVFKKIHVFEIRDKTKCMFHFCCWVKRFIAFAWKKMTSRHKRQKEREEKAACDLEVALSNNGELDPAGGNRDDEAVANILFYLDKFSERSDILKRKAWVLRKYILLKKQDAEISDTKLAKKLLVSRQTLWRYSEEFSGFCREQGYAI